MAKIDLTWTRLTELNEQNILALPTNLSCVYRLSYLHTDTKAYVFYVGQAQDLKTSLAAHRSTDESNICIKNYIQTTKCFFKYAPLTEAAEKNSAHRQLYKFYQPSCNDQLPDGDDNITINVS